MTRRYGQWAGDRAGQPEDETLCIENVRVPGRWPRYHQCRRRRGYGPEGLYCRQHDPAVVAARTAVAYRRQHVAFEIDFLPLKITAAARAFFSQRGSLDDVEKLVREYEELLEEKNND